LFISFTQKNQQKNFVLSSLYSFNPLENLRNVRLQKKNKKSIKKSNQDTKGWNKYKTSLDKWWNENVNESCKTFFFVVCRQQSEREREYKIHNQEVSRIFLCFLMGLSCEKSNCMSATLFRLMWWDEGICCLFYIFFYSLLPLTFQLILKWIIKSMCFKHNFLFFSKQKKVSRLQGC
jgi:hypothetical protein